MSGSCSDQVGNTANAVFSGINIDRTRPNAPSIYVIPGPNAAGWNNAAVSVSFASNGDSGSVQSGVAGCSPAVVLSAETAGSVVTGTCVDVAGNISAAASTQVKIDTTAPAVSLLGVTNGAIYVLGSVPATSCSTTDLLSGVANPAVLSVTGGSLHGTGNFIATCGGALDRAGNATAPVSVSFSVGYVFQGFLPETGNFRGKFPCWTDDSNKVAAQNRVRRLHHRFERDTLVRNCSEPLMRVGGRRRSAKPGFGGQLSAGNRRQHLRIRMAYKETGPWLLFGIADSR